jgi:hypothetical protein
MQIENPAQGGACCLTARAICMVDVRGVWAPATEMCSGKEAFEAQWKGRYMLREDGCHGSIQSPTFQGPAGIYSTYVILQANSAPVFELPCESHTDDFIIHIFLRTCFKATLGILCTVFGLEGLLHAGSETWDI